MISQLRNGLYRAGGRVDSLLSQMQKGPSEGWVTFVLLLLSVLMTVWSLGSAQWAPTPGLYGLALLAVLVGLVLAKLPFRGWLLAISGLLLGVLLSFFQLTGLVEAAAISDRFAEVGNRLFVWGRAFVGGDVNPESLLVSLFLLLTLWLVGFMCSWSFFRKHSILGAVFPSGLVMIVNLTILPPGAQRLPLYLYLLVVCLLVGRLFVLEREHDWSQRSVQRRQLDSLLVPKAFRLALMVVVVTAILPAPSAEIAPVAAVWDTISSPVRTMTDEFAGVVRGVSSEGSAFDNSFGETSPFRASTTLEEEPVLIVEAPFPVHLRARSYDLYTHTGWETGETQMVSPELGAEQNPDQESQKSRQVEVSAKVMFSLTAGEPIYLGGYPVDMSIDYELEVLQPARYQIALLGSEAELAAGAEGLPADLQEAVSRLREMSRASHGTLTESDIQSALPGDVRVLFCEFGIDGIQTITVERHVPFPPDALSVRTATPVSAGDSYRATVSVSTASESDLLAADTGYPGWVLDKYLQLPDTMPSRVIELAQELTKDIEAPYEKAIAIRDYLRAMEYALDMEAPADGTDGVDYFLFEVRKGYCQYFASAMTVLLRASGVPTRMAAGYNLAELVEQYGPRDIMGDPGGAWQDLPDTFVVRNGHSWSEVFFPGYGWIPFEPTPVYPLIARGEVALPTPDAGGIDDTAVEQDITETGDPWSVRILAVSLGLALIGAIIWLGWRRLLGQVSDPRVAYARIGYLAALSGVGPRENLTPQEYGRKLAAAMPQMAEALDQIVHTYMAASYSRYNLDSEDRSKIAKAWPEVRNHLLWHAVHRVLPFRFGSNRPKPQSNVLY